MLLFPPDGESVWEPLYQPDALVWGAAHGNIMWSVPILGHEGSWLPAEKCVGSPCTGIVKTPLGFWEVEGESFEWREWSERPSPGGDGVDLRVLSLCPG